MLDFVYIPHFLLQAESHTQLCAVTFQQHQKSVKKVPLKDSPLLTLQVWLQGLSGSCSKHPENKGATLAEPQQHRNWEQILNL